ncbi:hypothetical protein DBR07_04460 [Aeromonas sp. HMWF036]|nr:hypothetical protein [Aeromonas veronii]PTS79799.1 hypothetical protein DBR07_04460 [Aeromonas sp. HMWF036]PTT31298.1 hypothetical protein DBR30_03580 [Aeromonas sp. HMWF017]TNI07618.1 hypothetical protein CF135_05005 [Aeromonas veronii]BEE14527.1 hypothetical protein VAWG004_30300 [Aeromonas veronii]
MIIDVNRNAAFGRYFFWVADRYFDLTRFELSMQANENKRPRKVGPGGIWPPEHYYIQDDMSNRMEYGYEQ